MRTLKPLLLAPALLLVLAGCGSSTKTASSTPSVAVTSAAAATSAPDADASSPADTDASSPADADASSDPDSDSSADPDATDSDADSDSDADGDADPADATKTCDADATKPDADATLPAGFPAVTGFVGISEKTAGSTSAIKGAVMGGPDDLPTVRDAGIAKLVAAGYKEGDHDQEAGAEADGDFTGPHNGNINVRNLCKGYLVVTYTLNS